MRSVYETKLADSREIERNILRGHAKSCSGKFGRMWKSIYPFKSAEELAAQVGCSVRSASYQLSGEQRPTAESLMALMSEAMK